jgi:hypothetical protein
MCLNKLTLNKLMNLEYVNGTLEAKLMLMPKNIF